MDGNAQFVKQLDSTLSESTAQDIGTPLGSDEARHCTMLMLRGLFDNSFLDFTFFNGYDGYLGGLAEMRPQHTLIGGDCYFLCTHFVFALYFKRAKIQKNLLLRAMKYVRCSKW